MRDRDEDNEAQLDDLANDPGQVGPDSTGQSGDPQDLSPIEEASEESVEELADTDQASEAEAVEGSEDAADHSERPFTRITSTVVLRTLLGNATRTSNRTT
jgi:hypothetical protein